MRHLHLFVIHLQRNFLPRAKKAYFFHKALLKGLSFLLLDGTAFETIFVIGESDLVILLLFEETETQFFGPTLKLTYEFLFGLLGGVAVGAVVGLFLAGAFLDVEGLD